MKAKWIGAVAAVMLLFVACEQGEKQQSAVADKIITEEITYTADSLQMRGYAAYHSASETARPGILVVHEWWGHNDYARDRAEQLAEMGYNAFAVDMYGDGKQAKHPEDAMSFAGAVRSNMPAAKARFLAALNVLKGLPGSDTNKMAAIGYCFGGGVVLGMARAGVDLDAVVSFHGSLNTDTPADTSIRKTAILVCNGADDGFVPAEQISAFKAEMDATGANYKFINYPGALHSFTNPDADSLAAAFGMPIAYNAEADAKSWQDMQDFLSEVFTEAK
jgi:dienelactone hydrolase